MAEILDSLTMKERMKNSPKIFQTFPFLIHNFAKIEFKRKFSYKIIQVFKRALVWFSVGGEHYFGQPDLYEYMPDTALQESRNISIPIKNKVGRFVKIQLTFEDIWILISEIQFQSSPVESKLVQPEEKEDPTLFETTTSPNIVDITEQKLDINPESTTTSSTIEHQGKFLTCKLKK